jgi:hypothetical protein
MRTGYENLADVFMNIGQLYWQMKQGKMEQGRWEEEMTAAEERARLGREHDVSMEGMRQGGEVAIMGEKQKFQSTEAQRGREFEAGQEELNREWREQQSRLDRESAERIAQYRADGNEAAARKEESERQMRIDLKISKDKIDGIIQTVLQSENMPFKMFQAAFKDAKISELDYKQLRKNPGLFQNYMRSMAGDLIIDDVSTLIKDKDWIKQNLSPDYFSEGEFSLSGLFPPEKPKKEFAWDKPVEVSPETKKKGESILKYAGGGIVGGGGMMGGLPGTSNFGGNMGIASTELPPIEQRLPDTETKPANWDQMTSEEKKAWRKRRKEARFESMHNLPSPKIP